MLRRPHSTHLLFVIIELMLERRALCLSAFACWKLMKAVKRPALCKIQVSVLSTNCRKLLAVMLHGR